MVAMPRAAASVVLRRKLKLKATFESNSSDFRFKRRVPGAFSVGLIGSTCTAIPRGSTAGLGLTDHACHFFIHIVDRPSFLELNVIT